MIFGLADNVSVFKKLFDNEDPVLRVEAYVEGDYDIGLASKLYQDLKVRKQWDSKFKQLEVVETFSPNADCLYAEMGMPFPLENRDTVTSRVFFNNKESPELADKYGLGSKTNEFFILFGSSVERSDRPPVKGKTRATVKISMLLIEKIETNKVRFRYLVCNDSKTPIPAMILNSMYKKVMGNMSKEFIEAYKKIYKK